MDEIIIENKQIERKEMQNVNIKKWPESNYNKLNASILGLFGFGLTTIMLSFRNAHILEQETSLGVIYALGLVFGGVAQVLAGIFCGILGNSFQFVVFISYGCFWIVYVVALNITDFFGNREPTDYGALSAFFFLYGILTFVFFIKIWRVNIIIMIIFFTLTILFFLAGAESAMIFYDTWGVTEIQYCIGVCGIITGFSAFYLGSAELNGWWVGDFINPNYNKAQEGEKDD